VQQYQYHLKGEKKVNDTICSHTLQERRVPAQDISVAAANVFIQSQLQEHRKLYSPYLTGKGDMQGGTFSCSPSPSFPIYTKYSVTFFSALECRDIVLEA